MAIVVAVLLVFLLLGAFLGWDTWQSAEDEVQADAESLAGVAADNVAEHVTLVRGQLEALAANTAVPQVLAEPTDCPLDFTLGIAPEAHLDLVLPDGSIACSSAALDADDADHSDAPWLADLAEADGTFDTEPFTDRVTGQLAMAFAVPIDGPDGSRLGAAVVVVPTNAIASQLAQSLGDRADFGFALIDNASGTVLSAGRGLGNSDEPMEAAGYISAQGPVPGTEWAVHAGTDPDVALAEARSVLMRGLLLGAVVLVVLLTALVIVKRRIADPLTRLRGLVGDTGPNTAEALGQLRGPSEIVHLGEEFRAAMEERERFEAQLANVGLHDPVTGLANRALLSERLRLSLEHAERVETIVGIAFIDLDRFKLINESLGHDVGDQVLVATAARLEGLLRPGDTLARFGGDEFVIIRDNCDDLAELETLAGRILGCVNEPLEVDDTVVRVTASIGITSSAPGRRDVDLLRDAHAAMYLAKEQGRARTEHFDPSLQANASTRLAIETELQSAQERHELSVVYQPKIDLDGGAIVGVEALLRWHHPALGPVPPDTFIPIAEETGLMESIGRFVLEQACAQAAAWRRDGLEIAVAVNISGRQLADPSFVGDIAAVLESAALPPELLCLELTETLLMSDTARVAQLMHDLHAVGVQLSIDDFGTGYSSLAYLHRFPFDELKIDRTFVNGMTELAGQRTLVEAMVAMSKALGLSIVAEGVETEEQASVLRDLGCDIAQGYLYARPQPAEDIQLPEPVAAPLVTPHGAVPPRSSPLPPGPGG